MENKDIIAAKYIAKIIAKKKNEIELSTNEIETLENWIHRSEKNRLHYNQLLSSEIDIDTINSLKESADKSSNIVLERVKQYNHQRKIRRYFIAATTSAAVLILLFVSIPQKLTEGTTSLSSIQNKTSTASDTDVYLLTNGKKQIIAETENRFPISIDKIADTMRMNRVSEEMNTLVVPKCKSFKMELSDGTKIWINASSKIHFPTVFANDKRVVEIEGEVYFDVAHDKKRPFIVKTKNLTTEVLGTQFLVSSYNNSAISSVSLVSGSVKVNIGEQKHLLAAGRGVSYNAEDNTLKECDIDIRKIEGLLQNKFLFISKPLDDIMEEISRWYGVDVVFEDETMRDMLFFIRTRKTDNLEQLMKLLSYTDNLEYQLKNNLLTIKTNKKYE